MNAETWVGRATERLPTFVVERVRRDTLEHLQEAALPDGADVESTLGAPEDTAKELRNLYLTAKELAQFEGSRASGFLIFASVLLTFMLFIVVHHLGIILDMHHLRLEMEASGHKPYTDEFGNLLKLLLDALNVVVCAVFLLRVVFSAGLLRRQLVNFVLPILALMQSLLFVSNWPVLGLVLLYSALEVTRAAFESRRKLIRTLRLMA